MKKKLILSLFVILAVGLGSKTVFALANGSGGGIVVVIEHIVNQDNKESKNNTPQAPSPSTLKEEFVALNSLPEGLKLMEQSAGGSADLKALLN
jgi:hypothetical protein